EINGIGFVRELAKLINHFFFARQNLVVSFPVVIRVNSHTRDQLRLALLRFMSCFFFCTHLTGSSRPFGALFSVDRLGATAGWQITNVADTRLYDVVAT